MVYRPWGNSSHPGKSRVGLAWNQRILDNSGAGLHGATPIGTSQVIGGTSPRGNGGGKAAKKLTGIEFRPSPRPPSASETRGGERGSQSGSNDSGSEK